ncbi:hypothetical protein FJNA_00550 [Thermus sp. FJN-A]
MRKVLALLVVAFGLASAQLSVENLKPSLAVIGGTQGFGLEVSWHCLLFQPPVGEVRPALDLAYDVNKNVNAAFLFRYLYPVAEGLRAGAGLGVSIPSLNFGDTRFYFRADAEYDLESTLKTPLFLGGDVGMAGGMPAAQLKLGYRF